MCLEHLLSITPLSCKSICGLPCTLGFLTVECAVLERYEIGLAAFIVVFDSNSNSIKMTFNPNTNSLETDYDSVDESAVCSIPLPPLKKLDGAEPISGSKTIKSLLRTYDHAEYISTMNMSQHLKSLGRMSSRPNILRPSKRFFPPCIHYGDHLRKFDEKVDDGYLLGYSLVSKAFRVFNTRRQQIKKPITSYLMKAQRLSNSQNPQLTTSTLLNQKDIHPMNIFILMNLLKAPQDRWSQDKHIKLVNIIGNLGAGMLTRAMAKQLSAASAHECLFVDFLSEKEPKKVSEALKHLGWDETGIVIKNKARFIAQGYNQQEVIDYDETFAPVARFEAIRIFLSFATYMNIVVYQIDVKSEFLNGFNLKGYLDFDYAGCNMDKKAPQAEYVAATGCCTNILWMKSQLTDYDIIYEKYQLADIFTKPLDDPTFKRLMVELGSTVSE
uniref:Retrovirus-related Pol polyprotein from transposon TNT 1-94 n=1 Tax=Tanacetum cinerariifolium TaxID=118510 RepID=A0A6L2KXL6_TANCI|nr:retrovirus-related Pol polyprotein from transposon TNT 1-94 [Tanacetum cinerariifolium]